MVTVLEKEPEVGHVIRCAEGFFDLYGHYSNPPPGARTGVKEVLIKAHRWYSFSPGDMNIWMMDKDVWLRSMARQAERRGAEIVLNHEGKISRLRRNYDYVLDCSGCPGQSYREYGMGSVSLSLGIQVRINADLDDLEKKIVAYFIPGDKGYYWIFPKSGGEANVGIGWTCHPPRKKWQRLKKFLKEKIGDFQVLSRTSGHIPNEVANSIQQDNLFLCGDAAGLANPYHGGGSHLAVLSGLTAARSIIRGQPRSYPHLLLQAIRGERQVADFARGLLDGSYRYHEKAISYLTQKYTLKELFSENAYRRLYPFIHLWNLRCALLHTSGKH